MNKVKKLYEKALNKYEKGYIDDAIDICEEIMSLNMKHKPSINLKGLLYYFRGDLKSASALWKLNSQVNNDMVAKKYLEGLKDDEERFSLYASCVKLIRKDEINSALNLLMKCKESDYNRINVDNSFATCYIKLQKYDKAVEHVNRVLEIDINNPIAIKNKKKLLTQKGNKDFIKPKKSRLIIVPILVVLSLLIAGTFMVSKGKIIAMNNNKQHKSKINKESLKSQNKAKEISSKTEIKQVVKNDTIFPYEELTKAVESKNFNKIYELTKPWRNKDVDIKNKTLLSKAEDILKDEGVSYFYNAGRTCLDSNNQVDEAVANLEKAYEYGNDSYLYGHILFMLGVSYQNKKDFQNALKCYTEYDSKYPNENYIEEVLYRTAILYKDIDLNKSKEYAQKLVTNYPDCEYSNSKIKSIIDKK